MEHKAQNKKKRAGFILINYLSKHINRCPHLGNKPIPRRGEETGLQEKLK